MSMIYFTGSIDNGLQLTAYRLKLIAIRATSEFCLLSDLP